MGANKAAKITATLPGIALAVSLSCQSVAGTYGAGIENSQWYLSDSVFECSLVHDIPGYGRAVFYHRAGESLSFYLESRVPLMRPGKALVAVEAPAWRPGVETRKLGYVSVAEGRRQVKLEARHAMQLMQGLLEGMAPTVTRRAWYNDEAIRVRVSNINFARQMDGYQVCAANLLPVNYDQIRRSRVAFASGSTSLSDTDRQLLDNIAEFVMADSTVERIFVDGHSDRIGSRITNRALSEERAKVVADYLRSKGISSDMITVRAHGDQYPVSSRPADNRRTTIRLQRQGEATDLQQASGGYAADIPNG
jgi:outer membrane protein OmpA-like peptidoglycan-associated protein